MIDWAAVQAIAEAIGAIAVVASLVYLAIQVRQNTRAMRAATYDAMVRSSSDFLAPIIQDGDLAKVFESVTEAWPHPELDAKDRARGNYLLTQLFRTWENVFYQARQGTLETWLWVAWRTVILSYYHQPGIQAWWQTRHMAYSEPFREFLESSDPPPDRIRTTGELRLEP
jgi:hypothetical protein